MRSVSPCFWASAGPAARSTAPADATATLHQRYCMIFPPIIRVLCMVLGASGRVRRRLPGSRLLAQQHERCRDYLASATGSPSLRGHRYGESFLMRDASLAASANSHSRNVAILGSVDVA